MGEQANPLFRRTVTGGLVGMAITASTLLGADPAAAAAPVVISDSIAVVDALPGQEITVAPSTMDSKLRTAILLAMPLAADEADRIVAEFGALPPVALGTAAEGTSFFSGADIAEAATPLLTEVGLAPDKVDAVAVHFDNLVSLGNSVTVRAEAPEPPPPPAPEPPPPPAPQPPPPPETGHVTPPPEAPEPPAIPASRPGYNAPAPVRVPPVDYRALPGSAPTWTAPRFAPAPSYAPPDPRQRMAEQQAEQVQAVGRAEAMPPGERNRVALPVLIAALAIALFTAWLVRAFTQRRS